MKDLAKKMILASGTLRLAGEMIGASAAILMYHSVFPDPAHQADSLGGIIHSSSAFRGQMELLARDYHPISLDDLTNNLQSGRPSPRRSVVVTFDDGYADNYEVAMPILNACGVPATFYVTVDCIECRKLPWPSRLRFAFRRTKSAAWTDSKGSLWNLSDETAREQAFLLACDDCCQLTGKGQEDFVNRIELELQIAVPDNLGSLMMNYDHVRGLSRGGHIVGSHTMTHPNMAHVKEAEAQQELSESKQRLESQIQGPIKHFSYPCPALSPHWNERTVEQSHDVGYVSAVTTDSGVTRSGDNPLRLKRIHPTKTVEGLRWNLESAFAGRKV